MASLDFFAAERDQRALVSFLFAETDVRIFDSAAVEFRSLDELAAAHALGLDPKGGGHAIVLRLWSPSVTPVLDLEGGSLMQLDLGGVFESVKHGRVLTKTHFGHNTEDRATNWNIAEGADWEALKKVSTRIQFHVRQQLSVAKVPGRSVLEHAYELAQAGYKLKELAQAPFAWPLPAA